MMEPRGLEAEAFREGIARVEKKLAATTDPEARAPLEKRLEDLRREYDSRYGRPTKLGVTEEVAGAPVAEAPEASPEQVEAAEKLLREANVERMRNNTARYSQLLKQAYEIAPSAPSVLAAYADDLIARGQRKAAMDVLKTVVERDPTNVAAERKYAELVFRSAPVMLTAANDVVAGGCAAIALSAILPGTGQFVLGRTSRGVIFLVGWVVCVLVLILMRSDLQAAISLAGGRSSPNPLVFLPLIGAAVFHIGSIVDAKLGSAETPRTRPDRPLPPANLPFE